MATPSLRATDQYQNINHIEYDTRLTNKRQTVWRSICSVNAVLATALTFEIAVLTGTLCVDREDISNIHGIDW